jgi:hypothetical protein
MSSSTLTIIYSLAIHNKHTCVYITNIQLHAILMSTYIYINTTDEVYLIQHYVIKFVSDLIQHYVIKFVSDLRQAGGFLRFRPPIKLTATI